MSWLNNIRIPVRIAIACLLPLLAFTGFAGKAILEKWQESTKIGEIAEIAAAVPTITGLVHELQKERGSWMGFLNGKGAQSFADALRNQRPVVDKAMATWQQRMGEFSQRYAGSKVARDIDAAKAKLGVLAATRSSVDSQSAKAPEVIDYYGAVISLLATAIDEIGELTDDARIVRQAIALGAHVRRKEWSGQERAAGVGAITTGEFNPQSFFTIVRTRTIQDSQAANFKRNATQAEVDYVESALKGPVTDDLTKMRTALYDAPFVYSMGGLTAPQHREFLDMIIENVPSIIVVKDVPAFRYILINRAGERDFGIPRREMLGRAAREVLPAATAERLTMLDSKALESGQTPLISEHAVEMPNGDRRMGIAKRLVIRDDDGSPQYLIAVVDDVTERRRLEEDRNRNREFLNGIIENVPMTIFVRDACDQRYLLVNRAAETLWGIPREEIIGKRPRDLFTAEIADKIAQYDDVLLHSDTRLLVEEHELITRTNGTRLVQAKRISIRNEQGVPQYLLGVLEDVTESRAVGQQLQQSQKMEAVGNLTGGLAHDFNNLLTIMVGNLDLLQVEVGGNRAAEQKVATILQAAERGADLTHQLLAFSRRQHLSPRRVEVNELISNTTRLLARTLGENITVDVRLADDLWPVTADPGQLEAALVNIAINARDAMPDGGVLTVISEKAHLGDDDANPEVTAGDYVRIELRDTGTGMPADVLAHIFEPFFTTKAPGKGTGLGLSMVYGFIRQSGGHLSADSKVGEGTVFNLYLPRAMELDTRSPAPEGRIPVPAAKGKVILAVDDNPAVRATVLLQLQALGYSVHEADNAQTALALLDDIGQVDLLFTDIVMPGPMNGRELAVKARAKRPDLRVLYTSGFPGAFVGEDDRDALLNKPYRKRDLANAIHRALHARR